MLHILKTQYYITSLPNEISCLQVNSIIKCLRSLQLWGRRIKQQRASGSAAGWQNGHESAKLNTEPSYEIAIQFDALTFNFANNSRKINISFHYVNSWSVNSLDRIVSNISFGSAN